MARELNKKCINHKYYGMKDDNEIVFFSLHICNKVIVSLETLETKYEDTPCESVHPVVYFKS